MVDRLFPIIQYIHYFLIKEGKHSLQSPFVFHLYQNLMAYARKNKHAFPEIEEVRDTFLQNKTQVEVGDLGAGSHRFSSSERSISDIVRYSSSPKKFALLYQYFCSLTPAKTVIELGTCLGITSRYLSEVTKGTLYTLEGSEVLVELAKKHLTEGSNQLIYGDISLTLPALLNNKPVVDFAFLDANHSYSHTLSYFNQLTAHIHEESILIIGDIHWSAEMLKAWKEIIKSARVRLSIDFYECGVLLFKKELEKCHYVLHY